MTPMAQLACILRGDMPQVSEADIPELLDFLAARGVMHRTDVVNPRHYRGRQKVIRPKVRAMLDSEALSKPCLVSNDWLIIDGNHRWMACVYARRQMSVIELLTTFSNALPHIFAFPKTYVA